MPSTDTQFKKGQTSWAKGLPVFKGTKNPFYGKKHTEETKLKMRNKKLGKKYSDATKQKLSKVHKGLNTWTKGTKHSDETKKKMRESRIKYITNTCGNIYPGIGKNEKEMLDKLEQELNYRIIRQFQVGGYFLDGYIPEINLAIEIDESYHETKKDKDYNREEFIKAKLGCKFMRIKDHSH